MLNPFYRFSSVCRYTKGLVLTACHNLRKHNTFCENGYLGKKYTYDVYVFSYKYSNKTMCVWQCICVCVCACAPANPWGQTMLFIATTWENQHPQNIHESLIQSAVVILSQVMRLSERVQEARSSR